MPMPLFPSSRRISTKLPWWYLRYYTGDVNALVDQYLITDVLILYNINTFNDDHSILNLGDGLEIDRIDETAPAIKPDTVTLSTSFDPYAEQLLKVTLRNNSKMELSYNRRVSLEISKMESGRN